MAKKLHVRTLMGSQQVKGSKTLLKSARQYFCHILWSLWNKIGSKHSVLVVFEILRLFLNILTLYERNSLSVKASVYQFNSSYLKSEKYFLNFSLHFRKLHKIFNTLEKRWESEVFFFLWNCRLQKAVLLKWLKSHVSQHFCAVNVLKAPKHCLNLHASILVIFFDHSDRNSTGKIQS